MKHFAVLVEWQYSDSIGDSLERCIISPARDEDSLTDSFQYTGTPGYEGSYLYIAPSLKEAILQSDCNPFEIEFCNLSESDLREKDKLLSMCSWSPELGIQIKSE